jgi:hypothetical protein
MEAALRASADKKTDQIFYPTTGLAFDSVEEAYEFYNLYSWEVGFEIRYGVSNIKQGEQVQNKADHRVWQRGMFLLTQLNLLRLLEHV